MASYNDISMFELGLRSLCILVYFAKEELTLDDIVDLDYRITNGSTFDLPCGNLNGCSKFKMSELAARRERTKKALAGFSSRGYIKCIASKKGIAFLPTDRGIDLESCLHGDYVESYITNLKSINAMDVCSAFDFGSIVNTELEGEL